jgi:hypothetical protein
MMFYQEWAPNLPDIITHRAGLRKDHASKKTSFYIGGRVSAAKARRQPIQGRGDLKYHLWYPCPTSLVWLELLELMKGRSGVALTQFSSSQ